MTHPDCWNIGFDEYRNHLPTLARDFIVPARPKNRSLLSRLAVMPGWSYCWCCLRRPPDVTLEFHHIIHGNRGRADLRTNLMRLCKQCHTAYHDGHPQVTITKGLLLYCKWKHDQSGTDWQALALLNRSFLPDLEVRNIRWE